MARLKNIGFGERSLAEKAAEQLTQLIIDAAYSVGEKLPNEFILAKRLGVGRSTVREAIKSLCSQNILEIRHGSGTFVSENVGEVDDPLGFRFIRNRKKLALDLCQIRLFIEPELAAIAAVNAPEEEVLAIRRLAGEVEAVYESGKDHTEKDIALHTRIAAASGNMIAPKLVAIVGTSIPLFITLTEGVLKSETIQTHAQVVDAIAGHDAEKAREAMERHILVNRERLQALPDE